MEHALRPTTNSASPAFVNRAGRFQTRRKLAPKILMSVVLTQDLTAQKIPKSFVTIYQDLLYVGHVPKATSATDIHVQTSMNAKLITVVAASRPKFNASTRGFVRKQKIFL